MLDELFRGNITTPATPLAIRLAVADPFRTPSLCHASATGLNAMLMIARILEMVSLGMPIVECCSASNRQP